MSLRLINDSLELSQQQGVDPRERMIQKLYEQNQTLLDSMDKAQTVFEDTQAQKNQAIAELSKTNDDLREALVKAEARNKELMLTQQAEIQSLNEKHRQEIETCKEPLEKLRLSFHEFHLSFESSIAQLDPFLFDIFRYNLLQSRHLHKLVKDHIVKCKEMILKLHNNVELI
jgi:chromosome segregation ATPase